MDGDLIISTAAQRSPEWFAVRAGKATASAFADILATVKAGESASRKNYRLQLVTERLTGLPSESFTNAEMRWGIDHEDEAREAYMAHTGTLVDESGFMYRNYLEAGCSPDGLIDDDGMLEIKCPNSVTHVEYMEADELPSKYVAQVQGQLWIAGRQWCDFVSFDPRMPEKLRLFVVRVERDDAYIQALKAEVLRFMGEVQDMEQRLRKVAA